MLEKDLQHKNARGRISERWRRILRCARPADACAGSLLLVIVVTCAAFGQDIASNTGNIGSSLKNVVNSPDPAKSSGQGPASSSNVTYMGGLLSVEMRNATLQEVLASIAAVTGVKIDIPAGMDSQRMSVVKVGPGRARQVLAALLSGSHFDYLIQSSDSDPDTIQSVLLIPAGAKDKNGSNAEPEGPVSRTLSARERSSRTEQADTAASASPAAPLPQEPAVTVADAQPVPENEHIASAPVVLQQPGTSRGALTPPSVLNPENINGQLQQMYQQRMQLLQQERQVASPPGHQ
jgi:hypothetical protein